MPQEEFLFEKYVHFYHLEDKFVIFKQDEQGTYIEYVYKEGAPHDNRCLSWYYSLQPNAIRRNNKAFGHPELSEAEIEDRKKRIEKIVGNIFTLKAFTCGFEENIEESIKESRESWEKTHLNEPFIAEEHICKVGKPAPICRKNGYCSHWTYEEPVKCACWNLEKCNFKFVIPSKDLIEFFNFINK